MHSKLNLSLLLLYSASSLYACQNTIIFENKTNKDLTVEIIWEDNEPTQKTILAQSSDTIERDTSFNQVKAITNDGATCQSTRIKRPKGLWRFIFHTYSGTLDILTGKS